MKKIILFLTSFVLMCGCNKMLDKAPYGTVSEASFYKTDTDAVMAVNSVYHRLQNGWVFGGFSFVLDIWSDDCVKGGGGPGDNAGWTELEEWSVQTSNGVASSWWSAHYGGVYRANICIQKVSEMPDSPIKSRVLGEALFLRAMFYSRLVQIFGDLPYWTDPDMEGLKELSRTPASECWDYIIGDLQEAIKLLPESYTGADVGRATKYSAYALLGRAYLYKKQWQDAADAYAQIIKSGKYRLMDDFAANFTNTTSDNLPESVFEVQFASGTGSASRAFERHGWCRPRDIPYEYSGNGFAQPKESLVKEFEEGDVRRAATVMVPGDILWDGVPYDPAWSPYSGYNAMKYVFGPGVTHQEADVNFKVFRYSEILIGYAEAVMNGAVGNAGITGLQAFNMVRERAGLEGVSSLTLDAVLHERRVEFALEGHRFFDVVRCGKAREIFGSQFDTNRDELMFIPVNELLMNTNLKQNPGY